MKNKKMIVVDLDGTLLNIKGECSYKTKKYLKRLKELGYIIVIATGRVLRSAIEVTDGAFFANYVIANAGGLIYDMDNKRIINKNNIDKDVVINICNYFNDEIDFINICDLFNDNRYVLGNDRLTSLFEKKITNMDKFFDEIDGVYHVTVKFKDSLLVDKYYDMLKNDSIDIIVMQDSFTDRKWLEIFSKGVSKYNAIKKIMNIEKIDNNDVIAFGDGLNDINMLEMCGVGVAMGNALDLVKEVSDYVTISHNDNGVIYFLNKYLNENNFVS